MNTLSPDQPEQFDDLLAETPEDVAILYSWANLHGAKYRDFSASRREYRAQVRHRAAEDLRLAELQAKAAAEAAAAEDERIAREAERVAAAPESYDSGIDRQRALRDAEDAARRAAAERVEAARRAESAALAEAAARREEREIAEAHASAQRQAALYEQHESRRRFAAGPQPKPAGLQSDPYEYAQGSSVDGHLYTPDRSLQYTQPERYRDEYGNLVLSERSAYTSGERRAFQSGERRALASPVSGERRIFRPVDPELRRRPQGYRADEASGVRPAYRAPASEPAPLRARINPVSDDFARVTSAYAPPTYTPPAYAQPDRQPVRQQAQRPDLYTSEVSGPDDRPDRSNRESHSSDDARQQSTPAWLFSGSAPALERARSVSSPASFSAMPDTLQHSRERVASRWFALKGVFEPSDDGAPNSAPARRQEMRTPALAVFSLAGGVGKTSMVATLGRALSSIGEKVLLADTTSHGLLPYYFGASELRPGVVRTFSPPSGSTDAAIYLVTYDVEGRNDRETQGNFSRELEASASGTNRVLLDLNAGSGWIIRRMPGMLPTVLVPVAPDMNSVISLQAVEKYFAGASDSEGNPIRPNYILNQFDASLPLHLDVREVLRRQLGERLLPFVIRRAPAVSEALAEGMTVVDYAPDAGIAEDYMNIANWLRNTSAPASQEFRNVRWSER